MNKATHVEILGVQIPLRTLESVTSTPVVYATLGEWNNYYSWSSPDIKKAIKDFSAVVDRLPPPPDFTPGELKALFNLDPPFEKIAARTDTRLPVHAGINRQLFTYSTLTPSADKREADGTPSR